METLDLIIARTNLSIVIAQMRATTDDMIRQQPHKVDFIKRQEKAISDLTFSYIFFCELEIEYRISRQRNQDLEFDNMKNESELIHLRELVEQLKLGL